jgi:hypothetical protein
MIVHAVNARASVALIYQAAARDNSGWLAARQGVLKSRSYANSSPIATGRAWQMS